MMDTRSAHMDRGFPQASYSSDPVDPTAETVINGVPYEVSNPDWVNREPDDRQDAAVAAIKGRLVTAATHYLAAQRDTVGG
jgi:hypothetical protein